MSQNKLVLGIDPGISGAMALLDLDAKSIRFALPLPLMAQGKKKKQVNGYELAQFLSIYRDQIAFAVIEQVGVMTGQEGVVSMFNFGKSFGVALGVLHGLNIPTFQMKPSVWKGILGLSSDKKEALTKATKIFKSNTHWPLKGDHGKAEAALIAYCGLSCFGSLFNTCLKK